MAHQLADELLTMILSLSLLVPDALFAATGAVSPFSRATHSSSDVLLVCKRWMRLATPALYHTAVLRSIPQAKALADALKRNPTFGTHVHRLRLEGAYGDNVSKIVKAAPNIVDFCFTLALYADANVNGLVEALGLLNPKHVILTIWKELKNRKGDAVSEALIQNIARWPRLTSFTFAQGNIIHPDYVALPRIVAPLAASDSIRHVNLWWSVYGPTAVGQLLSNPQVNVTMFRKERDDCVENNAFHNSLVLFNSLNAEQRCRLRLATPTGRVTDFKDIGHWNAAPQFQHIFTNSHFRPLEKFDTVTHSSLWMRIIWFAVQGKSQERDLWIIQRAASCYETLALDSLTIRNISETSPIFKRLVENVCGTRAFVGDLGDLPEMFKSLCARPERAGLVQTVSFSAQAARAFPNEAIKVLSQLSAVTSADLPLLRPIVCAISRGSFRGLRVLSLTGEDSIPSSWPVGFLDLFPALERLKIDLPLECETPEPIAASDQPVVDATHGLYSLTVASCPPEFLQNLSQWSLPNLQEFCTTMDELDLGQDFNVLLRTHGYTLRQCILNDNYPPELLVHAHALEELTIEETRNYWEKEFLPFFKPVVRHASLVTLKLKIRRHDPRNFTGRKINPGIIDGHWKNFLDTFQRERYPALKTIHILSGEGIWPTTEREMKSNTWHRVAEELLDRGIALLDKDGRAWRRRLR